MVENEKAVESENITEKLTKYGIGKLTHMLTSKKLFKIYDFVSTFFQLFLYVLYVVAYRIFVSLKNV